MKIQTYSAVRVPCKGLLCYIPGIMNDVAAGSDKTISSMSFIESGNRFYKMILCAFSPGLILLILLFSTIAESADLFVPDDYQDISEALEMAEPGDTVVVMPGVYRERIKMKAGVSLVSFKGDGGDELVDGPGLKKVLRRTLRTIIDGSQIEEPGYLISFPSETTEPMKVDGFTFQNMPKYRSGVRLFLMEIRGCSPSVVNNIFRGNKSWGGILASGLGIGMGAELHTKAKPEILNNIIYGNSGPGIANGSNSAALIAHNEIFQNRFPPSDQKNIFAPGIGIREKARPVIHDNICYQNEVGIGALNLDNHKKPLKITQNRIYGNMMAGINIRGTGSPGKNTRVFIEFNQIFNNRQAGIRCIKTSEVIARFNAVFQNRKAGISLWDVGTAAIEDNEIYGNFTSGIRLLDVAHVYVRRNHIFKNVTTGIDFIGWEKR